MMIAIMGDSFDKVYENKQQAILKLKLDVMSDFVCIVPGLQKPNKFLFVA